MLRKSSIASKITSPGSAVILLVAAAHTAAALGSWQQLNIFSLVSALMGLAIVISAPVVWSKRETIMRDRLLWLLIAFTVLVLWSLVRSDDPARFGIGTRIVGYLLTYIAITSVIQKKSQIRIIFAAIALGAVIQAVIVISDFFTAKDIGKYLRGAGSFENPNAAAYPMMLGLIVAAQALLSRRSWQLAAAVFVVGLVAFAIALTLSKAVILGLGVAIVVYMLASGNIPTRFKVIGAAVVIVITLAVLLGALTFTKNNASPEAWNTVTDRLDSVPLGFKYWAREPVLGTGFDEFRRLRTDDAGVKSGGIHNVPFNVLVEMGAIAFVLYIAVMGTIIVQTAKTIGKSSSPTTRRLFALILAILISQHAFGQTHQNLVTGSFWMTNAIAVAAYRHQSRDTPD
jgi:O-antigen ligase